MNATLVLLALLAQASPPTSNPVAKARAQVVLKEGTALYQQGAFADALNKFEEAHSIYPSPKLFFNIGQANRELGRPVEAVMAFERFLAEVEDATPSLTSEARMSVDELSRKVGKILIDCEVAGVEISVDGKVVGKAPLADAVRALPGPHQVTATHPEMIPVVETVEVAAGTVQTLSLRPRPLGVASSASHVSPPTPSPLDLQAERSSPAPSNGWWLGRKWTWVAASSTVVFVAGAAISGSMMQSKYDDLRKSCGTAAGAKWTGCSADQIGSLDTRKNVANVLWGLGAAAAVTTGVFFFVEGHDVTVAPMAGETTGLLANVRY